MGQLVRETLHASAAETISGNSADFNVAADGPAAAYLVVSASGGTTPTLDVTIEAVDPVSLSGFVIGTFAQLPGVGSERLILPDLPDLIVRALWVIAGTTPTFTFSLSLVAKDRG